MRRKQKIGISSHVKRIKDWNKKRGRALVKRKKKSKPDRYDSNYAEWRKAVYERDDYTCQECGKKEVYLNAHHIRPWSLFPDDRYEVDNGVTLCQKCHKKVHERKSHKFLDLGYGRNKPIPRTVREKNNQSW